MGNICPKCSTENSDSQKFCGECATPLPGPKEDPITRTFETSREELTTGSVFAERYQIIEELGKGGMGKVYRALDKKLNEEVALKLIKPEIAVDNKIIERFKNELKLARKIGHPNIGRMYELQDYLGAHYITMEYVAGQDMRGLIRQSGQLTIGTILSFSGQLCEGLAEAHRLGIVHRDLKPNNIMIDKEGQVRIMDFGIARSLKTKGITDAGVVFGTPEYMSPEQVEGKEIDRQSDIYSLGVLMYEMATGRVPFTGETPLAVGIMHKSEKPQDPADLNTRIPPELSLVILKCLEKDKAARYGSALEILTELRSIAQGVPTAEKILPKKKPLTSREITVQFNLKKLLIPALVFVGLVAAALIVIRMIPGRRQILGPKIENSIAVIGFENQTGDPAYDYLRKAIPSLLITNLEQTGGLYVATWERLFDLLKQMGRSDMEIIERDAGFDACLREGITSIVTGSFIKAGDVFVTEVKVLDVETKRLLKTADSRGEGVDSILMTQIDELCRNIAQGIGLAGEKDEPDVWQISEMTTDSIEAYQYVLKSSESYDKFLFGDTRFFAEKALEIDPEFALAHLLLGVSLSALGSNEAAAVSIEQAKKYSKKIIEKERLFIEYVYATRIERDLDKKHRILTELADKYPKEKKAIYHLGLSYHSKGMFEESIATYLKALELDPTYGAVLNDLAYVYSDKGDTVKALFYFEKYASVHPEDANPLDSMAELYLRMGRLDEAIAKYKEALGIEPTFSSSFNIAYVYALKEDYEEALKWNGIFFERAISPGIKADGIAWQGIFYFLVGRRSEAFEILDKAEAFAEEAGNPFRVAGLDYLRGWFYYDMGKFELGWKYIKVFNDYLIGINQGVAFFPVASDCYQGLIEARLGRTDSANFLLDKVKLFLPEMSPSRYQEFSVRYSWALTELLMAQGLSKEAVAVCRKTQHLPIPSMRLNDITPYNMPLAKDFLARAYFQNGQIDEAIAEYKRLMTIGQKSPFIYLVHPKYHLYLAKLYEEKGLPEKAVEQYEKFLDLWKDADPGSPELEEARKRLAELTNN